MTKRISQTNIQNYTAIEVAHGVGRGAQTASNTNSIEVDGHNGSEPIFRLPINKSGPGNSKGIEIDLKPKKVSDHDIMTQVLPSSSIKDSQEFKKISESILKLSQERENRPRGEEVAPVLAGSNFIYMQNYANEM